MKLVHHLMRRLPAVWRQDDFRNRMIEKSPKPKLPGTVRRFQFATCIESFFNNVNQFALSVFNREFGLSSMSSNCFLLKASRKRYQARSQSHTYAVDLVSYMADPWPMGMPRWLWHHLSRFVPALSVVGSKFPQSWTSPSNFVDQLIRRFQGSNGGRFNSSASATCQPANFLGSVVVQWMNRTNISGLSCQVVRASCLNASFLM